MPLDQVDAAACATKIVETFVFIFRIENLLITLDSYFCPTCRIWILYTLHTRQGPSLTDSQDDICGFF
jgi:hypothetical protein